jgi:hypothetical protein
VLGYPVGYMDTREWSRSIQGNLEGYIEAADNSRARGGGSR